MDWLQANADKTLDELKADLQWGPIPSVTAHAERFQERPQVIGSLGSLDTMLIDMEAQPLEHSNDPGFQPTEYVPTEQGRPDENSMDALLQDRTEEQTSQKRRGKVVRMVDRLFHRTPKEDTHDRRSRGAQEERSQEQSQLALHDHFPHQPQPEMGRPSTHHLSPGFSPPTFTNHPLPKSTYMSFLEDAARTRPRHMDDLSNHYHEASQGLLPPIGPLLNIVDEQRFQVSDTPSIAPTQSLRERYRVEAERQSSSAFTSEVGLEAGAPRARRLNRVTASVGESRSSEPRGRITSDQASSTIGGNANSESGII